MRRAVLVFVASLGAAAAGLAQQAVRDNPAAPRGTASVSGTVVIASDGDKQQPARRTRVTLNNTARTSPGQTVTTDDAGRFVFRDLPAGKFDLHAVKPAYLTGSYGARRPERAGVPIVVKEGEAVANLVVTIARGGVIGGTVRDNRNRPVTGVSVRLLRFGYSPLTGERTLGAASSGSSATTDDRGEYRAFGLPPGTYLVLATPTTGPGRGDPTEADIRMVTSAEVQQALRAARGGGAVGASPPLPPDSPARVNYAPVFHPGVNDLRSAAAITLGLSEERLGVDIAIQYVATARVSGSIEGIPSDMNPNAMGITLAPVGAEPELLAGAGLRGVSTRPAADGTFAFVGVAPGLYTVKASTVNTGGRGIVNAPVAPPLWAAAEVSMNGVNTTVALRLQPGLTVNGRVVFEGAPQPAPADVQALRIMLVPSGSGGAILSNAGGQVGADGRFSLTGLTPDAYRFLTQWGAPSASARWTLKGSTANGRDALDSPLRVIPNEATDWTLTYTDRPSVLSGVFQDRSGRAATDYFLLVFPTDRKHWTPGSRRVRMLRPASDGAFTLKGLADGEYYLAALTDLETGEWNDAQLLEQLVGSAIKVTLREGVTTTQDLKIGG